MVGLLDTADNFGLLRFYQFRCESCGHLVAVERAGFRRSLLGTIR